MTMRVSPAFHSLKPQDMQTPEALTDYFMRDIIGTAYEERHLNLELGGFWFDILNPQITGLEGELMLLSPSMVPTPLYLLFRLVEGRYIHQEVEGTLWRRIESFSSPKQRERVLAGCKKMFDIADAFESGEYQMELELQDVSGRSLSIYSYTPKSLTLRGKNIPLYHPLHLHITLPGQTRV